MTKNALILPTNINTGVVIAKNTAPAVARPEIQAILNMNPLHYIELRFINDPKYGTLIYQDRAGTTPVTAAGQFVGWAKNLGSAGATHPFSCGADSARPVFQGTAAGTDFTILAATGRELFANALTPFTYPITTFANAVNNGPMGGDSVLWLTGSIGANQLIGALVTYQPSGLADEFWESIQIDTPNSDFRLGTADPPAQIGTYHSYITEFSTTAGSCTFIQDGVQILNPPADPLATLPTLTLLSVSAAAEAAPFIGLVKTFAMWDRLLSPAEQTILTGQVIP